MKMETTVCKSRILIVDDHPVVRYGIGRILNAEPDMKVCAEADDGPAALQAIQRLSPDLVLLDISLKTIDGLSLMRKIHKISSELPVLILSMHQEMVYARKAVRAGAKGYLMKEESPAKLVDAVRRVLKGETVVSDSIQKRIFILSAPVHALKEQIADALSDRERQIFTLYGQGFDSRRIADKLKLSMKTIETHRARIRLKLNLDTPAEFVLAAVDWVS